MAITDAQVADILDNAVAGINPVLDTLAERDPIGLKGRTFRRRSSSDSRVQRALNLLSGAVNATDWPGTQGWTELSQERRARWWVSRIGSVNTVAVAYPGLFGAWTKRLPLTSVLGFANQAMVLVAVAREFGVTERKEQVRLLGSVLLGRDISADEIEDVTSTDLPAEPEQRKRSLFKALWETGKRLKDLSDEVDKRPGPNRFFRMLGYIPILGAPGLFLGERIALSRAAKGARAWIASHPEAVTKT